jgi:hypothetical protein
MDQMLHDLVARAGVILARYHTSRSVIMETRSKKTSSSSSSSSISRFEDEDEDEDEEMSQSGFPSGRRPTA